MTAQQIVAYLLESNALPTPLHEASVHLPRRGTRWVASFRDATGRQVWKATGLVDREAALGLARQWEEEARQRRPSAGAVVKKPAIRVRAGSAERALGLLSQREVAALLQISERAVREIEQRAIAKLRRHPALREFWREWQGGEIEEAQLQADWQLSRAEMHALVALARTPVEHDVLAKLFRLCCPATPE